MDSPVGVAVCRVLFVFSFDVMQTQQLRMHVISPTGALGPTCTLCY